MGQTLYFAYGSNMNLDQMEYRCPSAQVVGNVRLEDYRLTFCSHNPDRGVATILPETGSHVDGLLSYLTQAKRLQLFDNGKILAADDVKQVLTLVTCSYEWNGARNIVVAVRDEP